MLADHEVHSSNASPENFGGRELAEKSLLSRKSQRAVIDESKEMGIMLEEMAECIDVRTKANSRHKGLENIETSGLKVKSLGSPTEYHQLPLLNKEDEVMRSVNNAYVTTYLGKERQGSTQMAQITGTASTHRFEKSKISLSPLSIDRRSEDDADKRLNSAQIVDSLEPQHERTTSR